MIWGSKSNARSIAAGDGEWTLLDLGRGSEGPIPALRQKSKQPPGNDAQVIGVKWRGRALTCTSGLSQHRSSGSADPAPGKANYR